MTYTKLLWAGLLWLLACGQALAQPQPGIIDLDPAVPKVSLDGRSVVWVDPDGAATIAQVAADMGTDWSLRMPGTQYNIDGRALWIRFDVRARNYGHWFLELASSGLDRVQLFHQGAHGEWVTLEAGDSRAVSDWPLPGRFPTFELEGSPDSVMRYWLRIEHTRVKIGRAHV
mgnify:CR=1 FL=1